MLPYPILGFFAARSVFETIPMRNLLACLTAALILAGCSSEQDAQTAALASQHSLATDNGINVVPSAAERGIGFASLPDRGTLLA